MSLRTGSLFATHWLGRRTVLAMTQRGGEARPGLPEATPGPEGVSHGLQDTGADPFSGLNLAGHVGDDPDRVRANREALAAALGVPARQVLFLDQTHGAEVVVAGEPWQSPPQADAAVTAVPGLHLAVLVADCVPVTLADDAAGVVGVAHAGRRGVRAGVVSATVAAMRTLGARRIRAVVGPSICAACYEVPADMREDVSAVEPRAWSMSRAGTPSLDLRAAVAAQLGRDGITPQLAGACTAEDARCYSYRGAGGRTGRFAGIAGIRHTPPAVP